MLFTAFNYSGKKLIVGLDSSVGTATCYGLVGPGIESRWGRDFPHPFRPALEPTQPPTQWVSGLFSGGKASGAWLLPPNLAPSRTVPLLLLWAFVARCRIDFTF